MLVSLYVALNFIQPGLLIQALSNVKPMFIASALVAVPAFTNSQVDRRSILKHPISLCLIGFILAQVLSVYYSGVRQMIDEFSFWYIYPIFVFLIAFSIHSVDQFRKAIWGLILGSGFVIGYGIYALYHHFTIVLFGIERVMDKAGAYGMYQNHNDYTFLIILTLPFIIKLRSIETGFVKRFILLALAIMAIIGVFLSLSRGGVLALVLELFLLTLSIRKANVRRAVIVLLMLSAIAAISYQFKTREKVDAGGYTASEAENDRMELWRTAYKMIKDHPIIGVGSRRFAEYSPRYGELSESNIGLNSHNTYIEVLATSGFFGFICFVGSLRAMLKELKKNKLNDNSQITLIREALFVSTISLYSRAVLDAKPHEWGFYLLSAFVLVYMRLRDQNASSKNPETKPALS